MNTIAHDNASGDKAAPLVSVVITAYRVTPYIAETLESVLSQTFTDYEIIVVNDGCPDTAALERAIAPYEKRLRYITQTNAGPAAARNHGIRVARGNMIAPLDGDDQWLPGFLERQVGYLSQHQEIAGVFTDAVLFGGHDDGARFFELNGTEGDVTLAALLRQDVVVLSSSMLVRRSFVEQAGLYDESIRGTEDYDLLLRLAALGAKLAYQREVLVRYRKRPDSLSQAENRMRESALGTLEKAERTLVLNDDERRALTDGRRKLRSGILIHDAKHALLTGDVNRAREALDELYEPGSAGRIWAVRLALRMFPSLVVAAYKRKHHRESSDIA